MPSQLETLVKILKLERQQGYKNSAVIGGLGAYGENWRESAHKQARKPEHHLLVDELVALLQEYDQTENKDERHSRITYMMDRITGRVGAPEELLSLLEQYLLLYPPEDNAPPPRRERPAREESPRDRRRPIRRERGGDDEDEDDDDVISPVDEHDPRTAREDSVDAWISEAPRHRSEPDIPPMPRLARPPREPRKRMSTDEAADVIRGLNADVATVKGVGPRMARSLNKLDIYTINDLLFFLPRRYDDYTQLTYISKLQPEKTVTVIGTVANTELRAASTGKKYFYLELDDGSGVLSVSFFGQPFLAKQIRKGHQLVLSGKTSVYRNRLQMTNPEWTPVDAESLHTPGIVPIYPLTEGLGAKGMRKLMERAVTYWAERLPDYVPEATLERAELASLGWAIRNLHFPEGMDHLGHAQQRFIFDQLLLLQMSILASRRDWQAVPGQILTVTDDFLEPFLLAVFPYELTRAQRRAIEDIRRDIATERPMNRLLQGDVGSGKTAVAITAMAMAFANGKQAALMAPTSILAEQHYRGVQRAFENMPGERKPVIGLLTSALTAGEREGIYNGLADGSIDIIIGTHALIQGSVTYHDLALAVIDEQHRFGVEQRGALRGKGTNPHILVMTATPIPRTLALTLYADLDLSVMDEMPPGRTPVDTRIVYNTERERIYSFVESELKKGRQAFFIHPLVEASETIEAASATEAYDLLLRIYHRYKVGLLHGRMKPAEKDEIMAAFGRHEFDILVTTSVAEVGVDIPNASVIVIEGANRFGLAQLHQFRGRVGRGKHASYCLLIPDTNTPEAMDRLQAMESTTDGFKLAELDWEMRGAGDLVGTRQSGTNTLQLMERLTPHLVELAQREARTIYEEDPYLQRDEHRLLAERVNMLYRRETDLS
ncbi:MAG: ATP-dependent DNA helicase RecG [Anaerolineae bacterium]